jgi:hypothetical protein
MVKADITTKEGMKMNIEGSEEEVKRIIEFVNGKKDSKSTSQNKSKGNIGKVSISSLVDELKAEDFFKTSEGKSLVDIKNALDAKGHIYPLGSLSGKVQKKVKSKELGRFKNKEGDWRYVGR